MSLSLPIPSSGFTSDISELVPSRVGRTSASSSRVPGASPSHKFLATRGCRGAELLLAAVSCGGRPMPGLFSSARTPLLLLLLPLDRLPSLARWPTSAELVTACAPGRRDVFRVLFFIWRDGEFRNFGLVLEKKGERRRDQTKALLVISLCIHFSVCECSCA